MSNHCYVRKIFRCKGDQKNCEYFKPCSILDLCKFFSFCEGECLNIPARIAAQWEKDKYETLPEKN